MKSKNLTLTRILTVVLGFLGAHKFYLGFTGMGFLYLFTVGLFGFGWIYDSIRVFIKPVYDKRGNLVGSKTKSTSTRIPIDDLIDMYVAGTTYNQPNLKKVAKLMPHNPIYNDSAIRNSMPTGAVFQTYPSWYTEGLKFAPEPENKHDSDAIRVDLYGFKVGYIPSEFNINFGRFLDNANPVYEYKLLGGNYKQYDVDEDKIHKDYNDYSMYIRLRK